MNRLLLSEKWDHWQNEEWGDWLADWQVDGVRFVGYPKFLYEIDLKRITSSAALLDVLFSVHRKWWATDETLNDLESAFQDLFNWCAVPSKTDTTEP